MAPLTLSTRAVSTAGIEAILLSICFMFSAEDVRLTRSPATDELAAELFPCGAPVCGDEAFPVPTLCNLDVGMPVMFWMAMFLFLCFR